MIAISYRREDSTPVTGRLYDSLEAAFGKGNVFMDFDSIPFGIDFREHIKESLTKASVLVVVIGPQWFGKSSKAKNRLAEPNDFVRLEIAEALKSGIPVIPVLVNNTQMPDAESLPEDIQELSFRNGLALDSGIDFRHHADRLIVGIRRVLKSDSIGEMPNTDVAARKSGVRGKMIALAVAAAFICIASVVAWFVKSRSTSAPLVVPSPTPIPSSSWTENSGDYTYRGKVGPYDATFQLHFAADGRVTGSYILDVNKRLTLRLEGNNPSGRLRLEEYTGEKLTAHLDLDLKRTAKEIRWEGMMYNVHPNTNTYNVYLSRPR